MSPTVHTIPYPTHASHNYCSAPPKQPRPSYQHIQHNAKHSPLNNAATILPRTSCLNAKKRPITNSHYLANVSMHPYKSNTPAPPNINRHAHARLPKHTKCKANPRFSPLTMMQSLVRPTKCTTMLPTHFLLTQTNTHHWKTPQQHGTQRSSPQNPQTATCILPTAQATANASTTNCANCQQLNPYQHPSYPQHDPQQSIAHHSSTHIQAPFPCETARLNPPLFQST